MKKLLKIKDVDNNEILIREENICTVSEILKDRALLNLKSCALITMTNGEKIKCFDPPYSLWENESLVN